MKNFILALTKNGILTYTIVDLSTKKDCVFLPIRAIEFEELARTLRPYPNPKAADGIWLPIPEFEYEIAIGGADVIFIEAKSIAKLLFFSIPNDKIKKPYDIFKTIDNRELEKKVSDSLQVIDSLIKDARSRGEYVPVNPMIRFYFVYDIDSLPEMFDPGIPEQLAVYMQLVERKEDAIAYFRKKTGNINAARIIIECDCSRTFLEKYGNQG
ncbi:MAG: hypothetical protein ACRCSQ_09215 [Bacteroidales bacterium]